MLRRLSALVPLPKATRAGLAALAAVGLACLGCPAASASWLTPLNEPPALAPLELTTPTPLGQDALDPVVAVAPDGSALVAWSRRLGAHRVIQVARRPFGQAFEPAQTVSRSDADGDALPPRVAFANRQGIVAWLQRAKGGGSTLEAVRLRPDGTPRARQTLTSGDLSGLDLAADAEGSAVAAWTRADGANRRVEAATVELGGRFSSPVALSTAPGRTDSPAVALDPRGDALVAWSRQSTDGTVIEAARREPGAAFAAPVTLTSAQQEQALEPQVVLNPSGAATIAWTSGIGSAWSIRVAALEGNALARVQTLPALRRRAAHPRLALAASGALAVAWQASAGDRSLILLAQRPAQGDFRAPVAVAPDATRAEEPALAIAPDGRSTVVWTRAAGAVRVIQAREFAPDGAAGPIAELSLNAGFAGRADLALDRQGNATAAWALARPDVDASTTVQAAGDDTAGPVLSRLRTPALLAPGQPARFVVRARDAWSAMGSIGWSFGDGAVAQGGRVRHAYAAPGSYTATVSAQDALGQLTTETRQVQVVAPGAPATGGA